MQPKGATNFNGSDDGTENEKSPEEKGHEDFVIETIKEEEKSAQELDDLSKLADLVLFRTKTVNPIDIWPDELIVDINKASVIHNQFFLSARVHSVMIKDVSDVFVDTGFFWAKLSIVDTGFVEDAVTIEFLSKDDALMARRIIQGLVVAQQQQIDLTKLQQELSADEIIERIEKLGKARIGD